MAKRSERLLALMQALRRRRKPVIGQVLADEMGISLRSLYRDIDTLKAQGAAIDGQAGLGFQLSADYFMPPLMFSTEETEALVLGLRTLIYGPDANLAVMARNAMAKISSVLPKHRRDEMQSVGLFSIQRIPSTPDDKLLILRRALREERQVQLSYRDQHGQLTKRTIYPVALGYYEGGQMLIGWCTLRSDYRHFRLDRMPHAQMLNDHLPRPRRALLHEWRLTNDLPDLA